MKKSESQLWLPKHLPKGWNSNFPVNHKSAKGIKNRLRINEYQSAMVLLGYMWHTVEWHGLLLAQLCAEVLKGVNRGPAVLFALETIWLQSITSFSTSFVAKTPNFSLWHSGCGSSSRRGHFATSWWAEPHRGSNIWHVQPLASMDCGTEIIGLYLDIFQGQTLIYVLKSHIERCWYSSEKNQEEWTHHSCSKIVTLAT